MPATSGDLAARPAPSPVQSDAELIDAAVEAVAGATPLALLDEQLAVAALGRLARAAASQPPVVLRWTAALGAEWAKIAAGASEVAPEPGDRRFAHDDWQRNPLYRRLAQGYLSWSRTVHGIVDELDLDAKSRVRSKFVSTLLTDALAPTNTLAGNPAALHEAVRTRGRSLYDGWRHFLHDALRNGGMPSTVDTRPFETGETIAVTPGVVVFRNDVLELLRYAPSTPSVHERPVLVVPPQINKYYVLDLAPGRSLVEAAVAAGQQVFMISWRNPGPEQRDWDLDTYVTAILEASDAVRSLTAQPDLNLLGVCAGGITSAAVLGHLAAVGDHRIHSFSLLVTVLDWDLPSTVGTFVSGPAVAAATNRSQTRGVLPGSDLFRLFAWLRPNDLVWNYWVNNYLMGKNPPAFDILAWNADTTNLPAGLHADFLQLSARNLLAQPGETEVLGTKVDLGAVTCDAYVVAGSTDHITPWEACYRTTSLLGGPTEFVLCRSGHIQTLVCPLENPKARYATGAVRATAQDWLDGATEHQGSWWPHWFEWLSTRSGGQVPAPADLGNDAYPVLEPAPGQYVRD